MLAVNQCWCLSFFGFLRPDLLSWGYRNRCFLIPLLSLIVRRTNFEVATKRLIHQQVKNTGVVLVPCRAWKCVPTVISGGMNISKIPGCYLLFTRRVDLRTGVSWTHSLLFCFSPIFTTMNCGHITKKIQTSLL